MGDRQVASFRAKKQLWKQFKATVKQKGFSTCFILENLIRAYLAATTHPEIPEKVYKSNSIVINQKIDYNVRKARRAISYRDNCYKRGNWIYIKPADKTDLRPNGHHISCECSVCRHPMKRRMLNAV